jgi:hypothetical protein
MTDSTSPLDGSLSRVRGQIDGVLRMLPEDPAEARRLVTRELEIDPRPEELQVIARIAGDRVTNESLRNLAHTALALRILAERGTRELFDSREITAEGIGRSAVLVSGLLPTLDTLESEVQSRLDLLEPTDRDYLLEVVDALRPSAEPLIAGMVVAPRLLALIHATEQGDPRSAVPSLTDEEVALLDRAVRPSRDSNNDVGRPAQSDAAEDLNRLLEACSLGEAIAEDQRESHVTNEELYIDALKKLENPESIDFEAFEPSPRNVAAERRRGLEQLGLAAQKRGKVTVYLTDEDDHELAIWTQLAGAKLIRLEPLPSG